MLSTKFAGRSRICQYSSLNRYPAMENSKFRPYHTTLTTQSSNLFNTFTSLGIRFDDNLHHSQLFGYDVLVDENLRPWLLEVNASPSLGASNKEDFRLKKQLVGDVLDIVDVEGRQDFPEK